MGARPVIFLPWRQAERLLAAEARWRVVTIEMEWIPSVDWTHERGWRVAGELPLEARYFSAPVASWRDAHAIFEHFDRQLPCAGVIPLDALLGSAV